MSLISFPKIKQYMFIISCILFYLINIQKFTFILSCFFVKKKKKEEEKTPGKIAKNTNTRILEKEMKVKYVFLNHLN